MIRPVANASLQMTMTTQELLQANREAILELAPRYGARNIRIFGPAARGEAGPESDVDFLVEMKEARSLLDLVALWQDLEESLGRKVDVVERAGLHSYIRDKVLKEAVPL